MPSNNRQTDCHVFNISVQIHTIWYQQCTFDAKCSSNLFCYAIHHKPMRPGGSYNIPSRASNLVKWTSTQRMEVSQKYNNATYYLKLMEINSPTKRTKNKNEIVPRMLMRQKSITQHHCTFYKSNRIIIILQQKFGNHLCDTANSTAGKQRSEPSNTANFG